MFSSANRRRRAVSRTSSPLSRQRKRLIAVGATLAVFGGIVAVSQVSSAQDNRTAAADCQRPVPGANAPNGVGTTVTKQRGRDVRHHWGDGQECGTTTVQTLAAGDTIACPSVADRLSRVPGRARDEVDRNLRLLETQIAEANQRLASSQGQGGPNFVNNAILGPLASKRTATIDRIVIAFGRAGERPQGLDGLAQCSVVTAGNNNGNNQGNNGNNGNNNGNNQGNNGNNNGNNQGGGLEILANSCDGSNLQAHDGFQNGNRCVSTAFGEVGADANNPSLLITQFPQAVNVNQPFTLRVSTRNLVRDRFLAAGQGGYYIESSLLNGEGLVRGHFHTACRMLATLNEAPDPAPAPAFFVATEDSRGGRQPDQIEIQVAGLPQAGIAQCSVWAGDGSHRVPMMARANQTPAFDTVRIQVGNGN